MNPGPLRPSLTAKRGSVIPTAATAKRVTVVLPTGTTSQKREIFKLEKPSAVRKRLPPPSSASVAKSAGKKVMKRSLSAKSQKPGKPVTVMALPHSSLVARPNVIMLAKREHDDFMRKINDLIAQNEKLKHAEAELSAQNDALRDDQNQRELEVEKLVQYWTIAKHRLAEAEARAIALEARLQRLRTAHVEQVSLLHKRVTMLQLKAEVRRVSATQTDPFGADADASGFQNASAQTVETWTAQHAHDAMRSNDEQLEELIADIEQQRLQAQTDFKFAVAQMEQKLRDEHHAELRAVKEERERQVEDISRVQNDRILGVEQEKAQLRKEFTEQIIDQKVQITHLNERLTDVEAEGRRLAAELAANDRELTQTQSTNEVLTRQLRATHVELKESKRVARVAGQLRQRLEKIEEINEILLGEYQKVEHERNRLAEQLRPSHLVAGGATQPAAATRALELGRQLDEIRRQFGGIHLS